jgi:hypothetical protein
MGGDQADGLRRLFNAPSMTLEGAAGLLLARKLSPRLVRKNTVDPRCKSGRQACTRNNKDSPLGL